MALTRRNFLARFDFRATSQTNVACQSSTSVTREPTMHLCRRIVADGRTLSTSSSRCLFRPSTSSNHPPNLLGTSFKMMSTMNSNSFSPVAPPAVRSHTIQLEPNTTPNGGISRSISEEFNQYTDYKSYERRSSLRNNDSLGLSFNEAEELSPPEGLMWQADTSDSSLQWAQQEPVPDLSRPTTPRRTIFPDYSPQSFPAGQANRSGTPSSVRPPPTTTVPPMVFACPIPQSPLRRNTLQFPVYEHELPTTFSPMMSSPALSPMGSPMMVDTPGASPTHSPSRSQSPYFYSLHSPARTPGPFAGGSPSPVLLYSSLAPEVFPRNHVRAYVTQAYPAEFESPKATDAEEQPRVVSPSPEKKPRKKKEPKGKAKSALNPPKAPPSMWQLFFKEYLEKVKEEDIIGKKVNLIDITKAAAALYKSLPATEVEVSEHT